MKGTLSKRAARVDEFLAGYLKKWPNIPGRLAEAMSYSLQAGGKRLRPVLCLTTASLFGLAEETALPFAAAIELIHTYSLIHDDLPAMDNDDLRRGQPSNHKKFGEATAILAGDGLLTDAFSLMAETRVTPGHLLAALSEVAASAGSPGMVGGQMLDMEYTGKSGITMAHLEKMHAMKTGAMLTASCVCGSLLAGAPAADIATIRSYGEHLGKAFQIADDILDVTGTTAALGKPAGSDEESGKNTYPSLIGIEASRKIARAEVEKARAVLTYEHPDSHFLRELALFAISRSA